MIILRRLILVLLLLACGTGTSFAESLFDRSISLFHAKAAKVPKNDYTFVVLGDSRDGDVVFRRALRLAKSFDPVFILHGGDYSKHGGAGETADFLSLVDETVPDVPLFVVMGNHENRGIFLKEIGPLRFNLKSPRLGLNLVAVDNSNYVLKPEDQEYLDSRLEGGGKGGFVAMHVPPKTWRWSWHTFTDGADELKGILSRNSVQGAFFSHVHLFDKIEYAGVPAFITGGAGAPLVIFGFPGDAEYHILVVRVKDGKATFRKVVVPDK
jgi:3',5'-cyclic-AMP phosphodiesterase